MASLASSVKIGQNNSNITRFRRSSSTIEHTLSLGQNVKCQYPNCGIWGLRETNSMCSAHAREFSSKLKTISDDDALRWLLKEVGLKSVAEVKEQMAWEVLGDGRGSENHNRIVDKEEFKGVGTWKTFQRPLTQYDAVPERGSSACTYISGCVALMTVVLEKEPDGYLWADCIRRGVRCFNLAKTHSDRYSRFVNLSEISGYVMSALELSAQDADLVKLKETLALLSVDGIDEDTLTSVRASGTHTVFGSNDLKIYFNRVLSMPFSAVVVTRQNETWSTIRARETVFLRDSHRRIQYDFVDLEAFLNWLSVDQSYFVPMPALGAGSNEVSLTEVLFNVPSILAQDGKDFVEVTRSTTTEEEFVVVGKDNGTLFDFCKTGRIFLGDGVAGGSLAALKSAGISHIVNISGVDGHGKPKFPNKFPKDYPTPEKYFHICVNDKKTPTTLALYIQMGAFDFIHKALVSDPRHKVLIHGEAGDFGKGSPIAMAYTMKHWRVDLISLYIEVLKLDPQRKCEPDQQFYKELVQIEKELNGKNSVYEHELIADAAIRGPLAGFNIDKKKVESYIKKYKYKEAISLLVHEALPR